MDVGKIKEKIVKKIKSAVEKKFGHQFLENLNFELERTPDEKFGDLGWECFKLAKLVEKKPEDVAKILAEEIKPNEIIKEIKNFGPYLNFFLNKEKIFSTTLKEILKKKEKFASLNLGENKTILIEFSSPNTNKPQHLGHMRNNFLGASLANLFKNFGYRVIRANLINDRGIHIAKSMLAYQKWGEGKTPEDEKIKPDHFVGKFYTLFEEKVKETPSLLDEARALLKKWEDGDQETLKLWQKMNAWAMEGFYQTYKSLGIEFDKWYYESETYKIGKKIVLEALNKNLCYKREDGAIEIDLSNYNLGKKVLIRADGTSVYITQDLGLAKLKYDEYKPDLSIYVVGSEQEHHFKVLFKVLEIFGFDWVKNCYHLSYGLVFLPSGRMKSREGTVIEIDDLLQEVKRIAKEEILKREKDISPKDLKERAEKIALASLKFFFLRFHPKENIYYDPDKEISFEGATGPYLLYTYARIYGILKKSGVKKLNLGSINFSLLDEKEEIRILKLLFDFEEILKKATFSYNPSLLANYLLELAQAFNTFYHQHPVLTAEENLRLARIALIKSVAYVLKKGLNILGIEVIKRM